MWKEIFSLEKTKVLTHGEISSAKIYWTPGKATPN